MKKTFIGNIVLPDRLIEQGQITVEQGVITYVGERQSSLEDSNVYQHGSGYIWPGLIDIHVHGSGGADVMDGTTDSLATISQNLLRNGVTGYLATTVTMDRDSLNKVFKTVSEKEWNEGEAEILGIHLEGPWICPHYKGAQNPAYIQIPKKGDGEWAYRSSDGQLKIVTLAPEVPGALDVIKELVAQGVIVSIGHTNATYAEVEEAVTAGASHITHVFNAMRGFHHREPGVVGAALNMDDLHCEIIVDGFHVHPDVVNFFIKAKGTEKTLLISDGMAAVGMPTGEYELGGLQVFTQDGKALLEDGTLAGSLLTLNKAIINTITFSQTPIWKAVKMASLNQAKRLGLEAELGSIEIGKRANLVAVDLNGAVAQVWIDGKEQLNTT